MESTTAAPVVLPRLLTAEELSSQTGLPKARVYALAREGVLPVVRFGRAMRFSPAEVAAFFAAGGTASRAA